MIDTIDVNHSEGLVQRSCHVCGATFAAARPQALYCSAACKRAVLLRKRHEAGRQRQHRRCPRWRRRLGQVRPSRRGPSRGTRT